MTSRPPRLTVARARAWRRRWDRQQDRYVPQRSARFDAMVRLVGRAVGSRFRALDLGCGTGSLSERLLARYPQARVVAVDFDPVTLALGRRGLGSRGGRLSWAEADLRDPGWARALPSGKYDAVVTTTALHWLSGAEVARVYRSVAHLLRMGGIFLNGDSYAFRPASVRLSQLVRPSPPESRGGRHRMGESWPEWWRAVLREPALAREAAQHRERFPRPHERTPTPDLLGHERRLLRAGFREVEVVWAVGRNRVLAALR